ARPMTGSAKQSIAQRGRKMDCFVTSLLAMTWNPNTHPRSRGAMRPSYEILAPQKIEGAGNAGCALHPRSRVQDAQKERTRAYRFSGGNPAFPARWLYGLCRALPGDEFVLSPSPAN